LTDEVAGCATPDRAPAYSLASRPFAIRLLRAFQPPTPTVGVDIAERRAVSSLCGRPLVLRLCSEDRGPVAIEQLSESLLPGAGCRAIAQVTDRRRS
jgi:hypothetical protein